LPITGRQLRTHQPQRENATDGRQGGDTGKRATWTSSTSYASAKKLRELLGVGVPPQHVAPPREGILHILGVEPCFRIGYHGRYHFSVAVECHVALVAFELDVVTAELMDMSMVLGEDGARIAGVWVL